MPKHLIPPIIPKPIPHLSTPINTHNPRSPESTRFLSDVNDTLLVFGRESFLHNLIDFLSREDTIESFVNPFWTRDVKAFAPVP